MKLQRDSAWDVRWNITFILTGLRTLADNGVDLPDPEDLLADEE